jgi:hypothetical protein
MGITHMLFNGGTLEVLDTDTFFENYIRDLQMGNKLYIIEKREQFFKFYLDVDSMDELDIVEISKFISKIVKHGRCLVAKARERQIKDKGLKYGFHLVWPDLNVNLKTAEALRQKVLSHFEGADHFIDSFSSGLRMLWSHKMEEGSTFYYPFGYVDQLETFHEFENKTPSVEFLKMFSIKSNLANQNVDNESLELSKSSLEHFIETHFEGHQNIKITRAEFCKNKSGDIWVGTNSKYCERVHRAHKSNHSYFIIKKNDLTIEQRCLDEDCKGYKSKRRKLPIGIIKDLLSLHLK